MGTFSPGGVRVKQHVDCKDEHQLCEEWAVIGECEKNSAYMKKTCPKACNVCEKDNSNPISLGRKAITR